MNLIWPSSTASPEIDEPVVLSPSSVSTTNGVHGITKVVAGPIPKSWALNANKIDHDLQAWRMEALSVILPLLPFGSEILQTTTASIPTFSQLCLRLLLSSYPVDDFVDYVIPYLPPHLRRDLIRRTALHSPLSNRLLYALCEPEGHADGELIIIGPQAYLRSDYFRKEKLTNPQQRHEDNAEPALGEHIVWDEADDWDDQKDEKSSLISLQTIILLSTPLSTPTLLTFPPTITHLALISLPSAIPVHRLTDVCPLLVVLDLSYNKWLLPRTTPGSAGTDTLGMVVWSRFGRLTLLGMRGVNLDRAELSKKVNHGRWMDIQIIS